MALSFASDAVFVKNLEASTAVGASQTVASTLYVDCSGLEPNVRPFVEQDVTAVSGTLPSITDTIDGSNDTSVPTTWVLNIYDTLGAHSGPIVAATAVGRAVYDVPRYRFYRRGVSAFSGSATPVVTRSLKIIGIASARPITQP